jgi:general secretion pathway protein G
MRKNRGFTLIELLIVVAIIGIIAAIAIPNLLNAINRGRQKRSMSDIRTLGTATEAYAVDMSQYPSEPSSGLVGTIMADHIEPTYVKRAPRNDGWNFAFRSISFIDGYSFGSAGRDKTWTDDDLNAALAAMGETGNMDCDIIYSNGSFTVWPEGIQN